MALVGLLKSIHLNSPRTVAVKIIDCAPREPLKLIVHEILGELCAESQDDEVAMTKGLRRTIRAVVSDLPLETEPFSAAPLPWILRGNDRRSLIPFLFAIRRTHHVPVHLLYEFADGAVQGKRPPDWSLDQNIASGQSEISVQFRDPPPLTSNLPGIHNHRLPLGDSGELASLLRDIRRQHGAIGGLVNILEPPAATTPFPNSTEVCRLLERGVVPLASLLRLTEEDQPAVVACVGPALGRSGHAGKPTAAMACGIAAKLVDRYAFDHPDCRTFFLHSHLLPLPSADSSIPESIERRRVRNQGLMKSSVLLKRELAGNRSPEREVLYAGGEQQIAILRASLPAERQVYAAVQMRPTLMGCPLLDNFFSSDADHHVAELVLYPDRDPFLTGHQVDGTPVLPAVVAMESCIEALSILLGRRVTTLCDLTFQNSFRTPLRRPYRARVEIDTVPDGLRCSLRGEFFNRQGQLTDVDRLYHQMVFRPNSQLPALKWKSDPPTSWTLIERPANTPLWRYPGGTVDYGVEFTRLVAIVLESDGAWGRMIADPPMALCGSRQGAIGGLHRRF